MLTRDTVPMNGKALLILITRAAGFLGVSFLGLSLLVAGISLHAETPGASTSLGGGADVATRTDAGNADAAQSGGIHLSCFSGNWTIGLGRLVLVPAVGREFFEA